jgi:hypothetical protein
VFLAKSTENIEKVGDELPNIAKSGAKSGAKAQRKGAK